MGVVPANVDEVRSGAATGGPVGSAEAQPKTRLRQIDALTGIRFFAAFSILISHATSWVAPFTNYDVIRRVGDVPSIYGMPLFFVLSGFVIHYNYGRLFSEMRFRWAISEFFSHRFARLYPLYFMFFVIGFIVDDIVDWVPHHPRYVALILLHFVTLTQSWFYFIVLHGRLLLNNAFGLAWSVSTEAFFYVAYVAMVYGLLKLRKPKAIAFVAAVFAASALWLFAFARAREPMILWLASRYIPGYVSDSVDWENSFARWLFYYSPYARAFEFILGCLTAQLYVALVHRQVTRAERRIGGLVLVGALLWLFVVGILYFVGGPSPLVRGYVSFLVLNFGCAVPIAAVVFCVSRYESVLAKFLRGKWVVARGDESYSIYAVHTWTLRMVWREAVPYSPVFVLEAVLRIVAGIVLTLIFAHATYNVVEVPWRRRLRARFSQWMGHIFGDRSLNVAGIRVTWAPRLVPAAFALLLVACLMYQLFAIDVETYVRHIADKII